MSFFASTGGDHGGESFSLLHSDSHHADAIVVPDAALLFTGNFHRAGLDLVLTGHDGHHYVVAGYFANEHPPTLMAPNGAHLSPDIVDLLAGSPAPNEYAQAQPTSATPADSIGKVQKVAGTATVLRNGVSVALNVGDVVYKSDVIVTGADSKVGVTFPDGTALELLPNTRMAVNEYNYDAGSSSNKALFTLVEGTFGFVAGKVAHAGGDMKIGTPVATMGIRGTTGVVQHVVNATLGDVTYSFSVYDDPGTTTSGSWDMVVQNPDGTFSVIATVSQTGYVTYVTPQGRNLPPLVTTVPLSASQVAANQLIIQDLFDTFALGGPHSIGIPGSPENPLPFIRLNFLPDIGGSGGPHAYNFQLAGLPSLPSLQLEFLQPSPQQQQQQALSNIFIWAAGNGTWPTGSQWNQGISPGGAQPEVILQSGMIQYNLTGTIYTLTIDAPAELDMIGGSLVVTNGLDVAGILLVDGDPPTFISYGTATIEAGGQVIAGALSVIEFSPDLSQPITAPVVVDNFGTITAQAAGIIEFIDATVTNEAAAQIESTDLGSVVDFTDTTFVNDGSVFATGSGGVFFVNSAITNAAGASITAKLGGSVTFETSSSVGNPLAIVANLVNYGQIAAQSGGTINIDIGATNEAAGQITSTGQNSTVSFNGSPLANFGAVSAGGGGHINIDHSSVTNFAGAVIAANLGGEVDFNNASLLNATGGQVDASGGLIKFDGSSSATNHGTIEATNNGEVEFDGVNVDNRGGTIEADGAGSIVQLSAMTVIGGTLVTGDPNSNDDGIIEIVATGSATVFDGAQSDPVTIEGFVQVDPDAELALKGTIDNAGTIDVDGDTGAELIIAGTVTLNDSGHVILDQCNDEIVSNGSASELDNYNTISGEGIIGDQYLTLHNETGGVIDADRDDHSLVLDTGSNTIDNDGTLEATLGATIQIDSNVDNGQHGLIEALSSDYQGSTVELDGITVSDGGISIDADSTLHIENGTTILSDVDVENSGNLLIDSGSIVAILDVEAGTTVHGGTITIGNAGELDVSDGTFDGSGGDVITIYDSGAFNIDGPLTVVGDIIIDRECGTFTDTGVLTVAADTSATLEGENFGKTGLQFGEIDIGTNAALTLENAGAKEIDFTGSGGTLTLETPSDFSGSIKDFAPGDTIDLAGIKAISVLVQGDEIIVNEGGCASYSLTLSDPLPSGDTIAFKSDGSGGTDLEVAPQVLSVADSQVSGTEGTPIDLNIPDAITGGSQLTSLVISSIPDGATLTDTNGVTFTVAHGSVTLDAAQIADGDLNGLAITTAGDTNFTLSLLATATDGHSFEYTVPATETVTVDPLAPTVEPGAVSGVEGAPIALNLGILLNGLGDDGNSLYSVTISDIPDGATLSDSKGATLTVTHGSITLHAADIAAGDLDGLAVTTDDKNFTLNVSAVEQDKEGNFSAPASGTESVSVTSGFTFVPTAAALSALEDHGLVLTSGEQIGTFFGDGDDTYTFTISGPDHDFSSAGTGSNSEALFTSKVLGNPFDVDGSTVYALTVDVKDVTLNEDSGPLPFDVVVDDSFLGFGDGHDIKLTGACSLGINAATPTIVYGLGGNDTIDATGMTANVWFVGGAGSDTMTGGSGVNTYVFASVGESETPREYGLFGGATDTITNFNAASDVIDLAPMDTVTCIQGLLTDPSTHINPDSVAWIVSGSEVIVYANTDPFDSHRQDSSSGYESEIILSASSHDAACTLADSLSAKNFILAPPPPSTPDLTPASDTGLSHTDDVTKDTTPTFTGTGTAGDVVTLFDGSTAIGSAVVGSDGCYTITSSALSNGTHWISAEQTDALGDTSALSCSVPVTIDTKAPTVSSITTSGPGISGNGKGDLDAGHTVTFTVDFNENVYVTGTPTAGLNDGGTATYVGGSGTNTLTFTYTVANGENTSDLALGSIGIALNGGAIQDGAGNDALLAASDSYNPSGTLKIDTTPPAVSSITMSDAALKIGDTSTVTITFSEAVTGFSNNDVTVPNGTLSTLTSSDGGVTWKGTFTPSSGIQDDTNAITVSSNYADLAGNQGSGATGPNYTVHTVAPVITVPSGTQALTGGTQTSISGVSVSENGTVAGETFSAMVSDTHGILSATGGAASNGGHTLTFTGLSLSDLKNDLASLTDTDGTPGADTITVNATDSFGNAAAQQTIAINAVNPATPAGFMFTPDAATLSSLEDDDHLDEHTQIGTFTESGGNAGDSYTFTIGGPNGTFRTSAGTNSEALLTNGNVGGGHDVNVYALTVQVNDTTNSTHTSALPFDVVVGNSRDNTINLESGPNNLGIAASTPTIVYGLDGNDTISASGMTANVWFVGGAGQDMMTGGSGQNTYLYANVSESDNGNEWGCGPDTITNFTHARDLLDFDPLSGVTKIQGKVSYGTELNANSIAWVVSGGNTTVYVNTDSERHSMTSDSGSVMEIVIDNTTNLAASDFILSNGSVAPAGVASRPINLALSNPALAGGGPVGVTIAGVPSDWQLSEGTNLGNGTWAIQSDDLSQLTITTAAAFAGAMVLSVTETWANADGTIGTAHIADNVEAYALGSPIFALAGDDNLSGAGGGDTFVFAQPIGNDTIYNFNAASDRIDLTGFVGIGGYGDLHIADDAGGNAVIVLGSGETITLRGVDAAALSATDFVFNQAPVTENHATMTVSDGAVLPVSGTIDNTGMIAIESTGSETVLQVTGDGITLDGGGKVVMSDDATITGTSPSDVLTNVDNMLSGSGQIGSGDGNLTLVNEAHGTINADVAGAALVLDTGHAIANAGLLEATNGGLLQVVDAVNGGSANIAGGTMSFEAQSNVNVSFDNGQSGTDYGKLQLDDPSGFSGHVAGFSGTDAAHSDIVDLAGIDFNSAQFAETYHSTTGVLSVTDGTHSANLTLDNFQGALDFASDGNGGTAITAAPADASPSNADTAQGTLSFVDSDAAGDLSASVTPDGQNYVGSLTTGAVAESNGTASVDYGFSLGSDQINVAPGQTVTQSYQVSVADAHNPAASACQTVSVSIGGAGNDNFVFMPGAGADTIVNFDAQHDAIELEHFANVQTAQELQSLITDDAHGNAVIDLGNHDSVTVNGMTAAQLQANLQNLVHLH